MKSENKIEAYKILDKYTYNEVAENEIRRLKTPEVVVDIPQEKLYDRVINLLDGKKIVLERKADILNSLYNDTKFAEELTFDYLKDSKIFNVAKYAAITGLTGYTAYSALVNKAPFLKLPGLAISLIAIHGLTRCITNKILEEKVDRPWKIHSYRVARGLGPTNTKSNAHNEHFNYLREVEKLGKEEELEDYLYKNDQKPEVYSIYKKINKLKKLRPFKLYSDDFNKIAVSYKKTRESEKYIKDSEPKEFYENEKTPEHVNAILNDEKYTHKDFDDQQREVISKSFGPRTTYIDYKKEATPTFEAKYPEENTYNENIINLKNEFDDVILFPDNQKNEPEYQRLINIITFVPEFKKKYYFDWELNKELASLKKRIHYLRSLGEDESNIKQQISEFNSYAEDKINQFYLDSILIRNRCNKETLLVHSESEKNHLKEYFNFISTNKINLLKEKDEEFDLNFDINPKSYNPWDEYKLVYQDLFNKGRKYFIIQSIPDWKFLQIRKPTPKRLEQVIDESRGDIVRALDDSIFRILALERYHRERYRKENKYHQERTTHRI